MLPNYSCHEAAPFPFVLLCRSASAGNVGGGFDTGRVKHDELIEVPLEKAGPDEKDCAGQCIRFIDCDIALAELCRDWMMRKAYDHGLRYKPAHGQLHWRISTWGLLRLAVKGTVADQEVLTSGAAFHRAVREIDPTVSDIRIRGKHGWADEKVWFLLFWSASPIFAADDARAFMLNVC